MRILIHILLILCWTCVQFAHGQTSHTLQTAAELCKAVYRSETIDKGRSFVLKARVLAPAIDERGSTIVVEDASGAMILYTTKLPPSFKPIAGDRIEVSGSIAVDAKGTPYARCRKYKTLGTGPAPQPLTFDAKRFNSSIYDCRLVQISGTVIDAFIDEIDPNYIFYILNCDNQRITVADTSARQTSTNYLHTIGRTLRATGLCRPGEGGSRAKLGRYIQALPPGVQLSATPNTDIFAAPEIRRLRPSSPEQVPSFTRRKMIGRVLATWQEDNILIRTIHNELACIRLAFGALPTYGETIEAVGIPETDLYQINLARGLWRPATIKLPDTEKPTAVSITTLFADTIGRRRFNSHYHGRRIRVNGRIIRKPLKGDVFGQLLLEDDHLMIPVDTSSCTNCAVDFPEGCRVEVEGVCVMDTETWSPSNPFPHVKKMFIAVSHPDHIRLLAAPPWWTPTRLFSLIGCLLLLTSGSLIWNFALKHAVTRKSRELKAEIMARLASDLKSRERTRLAVELHDSIAQNLSGVSMEIGSAIQSLKDNPTRVLPQLEIASRTLHVCRDELRDCLWDLRSQALEDKDLNGAIRTTLMPYVSDVDILVRFNVPRERFSDNTAHAILRIIRELVVNAVRHGHATRIRIAGGLDGRRLLFSVQDNGIGFDPDTHPGVKQGHFGLQGVRERITRFGGTMVIASTPGNGAKITLSMDLSLPEEEDLITI